MRNKNEKEQLTSVFKSQRHNSKQQRRTSRAVCVSRSCCCKTLSCSVVRTRTVSSSSRSVWLCACSQIIITNRTDDYNQKDKRNNAKRHMSMNINSCKMLFCNCGNTCAKVASSPDRVMLLRRSLASLSAAARNASAFSTLQHQRNEAREQTKHNKQHSRSRTR